MLAHGRVFYKKSTSFKKVLLCDRDRIQTCNRLIRSQLLYSVELRGQSLYFRLNFILKW